MKAKEEYTAKVEKMKKSSDILRYQDIPWPCEGTVQDMVDVMLADAKESFQTSAIDPQEIGLGVPSVDGLLMRVSLKNNQR